MKKMSEDSPRHDVEVALIEERHMLAATLVGGKYTVVLPVQVCQHEHYDLEEAVRCGGPRATALASVLMMIGADLRRKLDRIEKQMKTASNGHKKEDV
jgi:hypothetical protein